MKVHIYTLCLFLYFKFLYVVWWSRNTETCSVHGNTLLRQTVFDCFLLKAKTVWLLLHAFLCVFGRRVSDAKTTLCPGHQEMCPPLWIIHQQFCAPMSDLLTPYFDAGDDKAVLVLPRSSDINWPVTSTTRNSQHGIVHGPHRVQYPERICYLPLTAVMLKEFIWRNRRTKATFLPIGMCIHKSNHI